MLKSVDQPLKDGENNTVRFDVAYRACKSGIKHTISQIYQKHGREALLLPLSGTSAGGGVFQQQPEYEAPVIGILMGATTHPKIRKCSVVDLESIALDEIAIDEERKQICAGASITIDQLNQSLADNVSFEYRVPGSDLTSYAYAQVGSTFMTGGMGPQRRYFSDSVSEILLHNGKNLELISQQGLDGYAGTYGWTGLVTAVRCRYARLPRNELAFALPIRNESQAIANLLEHLSDYCFFDFGDEITTNMRGESDVVIGVEHITIDSMMPLIQSAANNHHAKRARELSKLCQSVEADGVLFIHGCTNRSIEEFLNLLIDETRQESMTIGGIKLDSAEMFHTATEMRELREAIPYAARVREPTGLHRYKNHTDANIRLSQTNIAHCATALWDINSHYVEEVDAFINQTKGLRGDILIYGHMNPYGLDPHNRLTIAADDFKTINTAIKSVNELRADFYRRLGAMSTQTGSEMTGGEKCADSEQAILKAFGNPEFAPAKLKEKYYRQAKTISASKKNFNWRSFDVYRNQPQSNSTS